mgnify:CR=1 FL=1
MKKIAILTSGGDAPGMNAAIRAVVRTALHHGIEVMGVQRGYSGLINGELFPMDRSSVSDIIHRGGTILRTARCLEFKKEEVRVRATKILKAYGVDALVVIGGDGSFTGAKLLSKLGVKTVGLPGTIDNDLTYTDFTIGFDTALNTVIDAIDKIRDTSTSHERVSIVEVMGRDCGDLALYAGIAGGAEYIITPEKGFDKDELCRVILEGKQNGKIHNLVLLAEGVGGAQELAKYVEGVTGIETRATVLGHIQRGGSPTVTDRVLASRMGSRAVEVLMEGKTSRVIGIKNNEIIDQDIDEALALERKFDEKLFDIANEITSQIKQYEKDYTLAEDDEKEEIQLYDYIDEKYYQILNDSEKYLGIISSWSPHPCAYLVYQGNIRKEIGLVMMRSNQGKKLTLCCLMDGLWAEKYHFLKNDLLKVNVVKLIKLTYKDIGVSDDDIESLLDKSEYNDKVMDIYKNGYTIGVNQVEQQGSRHKMMNYKAKNITEISAFVAAIRPAFKSMLKIFLNREHFDYGIPAFDNIIQTPEMTSSFILYQEMIMSALNYAGISMGDCYTVIKCISKKRKEKIMEYKEIFVPNFTQKIVKKENKFVEEATELANKVWTIIENSARYGFNASHAYCVGLDSLYGAYLKAYYPLNFYKTYLNIMNEKGDKDKISSAIAEMKKAFKIEVLPLRFRQDNRNFEIIKDRNALSGTLKSIKGIGDGLAEQLYKLRDVQFQYFTDLLIYMIDNGIISKKIRDLVSVNYFEEFGQNKKLLDIYDEVTEGKNKYDKKHTEKTKAKRIPLLHEYEKNHIEEKLAPIEFLKAELEVFGEPKTMIPELPRYLYIVDVNTKFSPKISVVTVTKNVHMTMKMYKKNFNLKPVKSGEVIQIYSYDKKKDGHYVNGKYQEIDGTDVYWITSYAKRIECKEKKGKRIYEIL